MPEIGRPISHYRTIEKVGAGGMGRVYRAEDRDLHHHNIPDARTEIAKTPSLYLVLSAASIRRPVRAWIRQSVIRGLAIAVAAALAACYSRPMPPPSVAQSVLKIESGQWLDGRRLTMERPTRTALSVAHDGQFLVYSAIPENPTPQARPKIYLSRMDQMNAVPIAGTDGGINPFLSPDDRWIGFYEGNVLKKIPVGGGVSVALCSSSVPFGADWGPNGTIVLSRGETTGLSRISAEGGQPEVLTAPDRFKGEHAHRLPHWLPDGNGVLFTIMGHGHDIQPRLAILDLATRSWRVVVEDAADGRWLRTGHLVFLRQGILMAVPFDLGRLEVKGRPVPVVANVMQALNVYHSTYNTAAGQYSVSDAGLLAYAPGGILPDLQNAFVRVDPKGNVQPVADFRAPFLVARFSPDGRRIAYHTIGKERQLWIYDLNRGSARRLTGDGFAGFFAWTPSGKDLVLRWWKSDLQNLYLLSSDGSSSMERLTTSVNVQSPGSFTPDGSTLVFAERLQESNNHDILLLDMKSRRVTPLLNSEAIELYPEVSPDGRWLAYVSNESGRQEVWVLSFPGRGGKWRISEQGGTEPIWSKDGKQLFYRQADQVWAADIRTDEGFSAGKPRLLFELQGMGTASPIRGWDLWPDGQGFLMMKWEEKKPQPATEVILVQNWFEELKRLAPTGKK